MVEQVTTPARQQSSKQKTSREQAESKREAYGKTGGTGGKQADKEDGMADKEDSLADKEDGMAKNLDMQNTRGRQAFSKSKTLQLVVITWNKSILSLFS